MKADEMLHATLARIRARAPSGISPEAAVHWTDIRWENMFATLQALLQRLHGNRSMGPAAHRPHGRQEIALAPLLVEWKPRFARTRFNRPPQPTLPRRNADKVFHYVGDLNQLKLAATVRVGGQPTDARAKDLLRRMQLAELAGYERKKVKFAGFNQLGYVFERNGNVLTPAGMDALSSGIYDRQATPATGDLDRDFGVRRLADAQTLARWLATLPLSTLESASAFSSKLNNSPMGRHFSIRRSRDGAKEPYLTDDDGNWRFYGPNDDATYEGLLRKLIHYAAGDPEAHWADQDRAADQAARASKAAGKTLHDVLVDCGFLTQPK